MNDFSDEANHQRRVDLGYAYSCCIGGTFLLEALERHSERGLTHDTFESRAMENKVAFARGRKDGGYQSRTYYICILEPDEDEDLHKLVPHLRR